MQAGQYGPSFEPEIYCKIEWTAVEEPHQAVRSVATAADEGTKIGYDMMREEFKGL